MEVAPSRTREAEGVSRMASKTSRRVVSRGNGKRAKKAARVANPRSERDDLSYINKDLHGLVKPIDWFTLHDENPRKHEGKKDVAELAAWFKEAGFQGVVTCTADGEGAQGQR